jgi:hypothetical protein
MAVIGATITLAFDVTCVRLALFSSAQRPDPGMAAASPNVQKPHIAAARLPR